MQEMDVLLVELTNVYLVFMEVRLED